MRRLAQNALSSSGLALLFMRVLSPACAWDVQLFGSCDCRAMALKAGLEAAKASIGQQQAVEGHERAATHKMLGALSSQARETEARALLQHEAAMAAMLAAQQAQVIMMPHIGTYPLTYLDWSSRRHYKISLTVACFQEHLHI